MLATITTCTFFGLLAEQHLASSGFLDLLDQLGVEMLGAVALFLVAWFRDVFRYRVAWIARTLRCIVTRSSYILIWNDDSFAQSQELIRHLEREFTQRVRFRALRQPDALRFYPLTPKRVQAIVLLDTDVTKLDSNTKHAELIEKRLRQYVDRGGGLVGGHDILWRRVRSLKLQEAFGGELKRFQFFDKDPVTYRINPTYRDHPLREGLPDRFTLLDGEVCWGQWAPDVEPVYVLDDDQAHYLAVTRKYSRGRLVWLNSGDRGDAGLYPSVSLPEKHFVRLLTNALKWVGDSDD